jgi:P pilus assembly chaperone PapD
MAASAAVLAAGLFSVSPVRVDLRAGQHSASVEVVNTGDSRIQITVERLSWAAGPQGDLLDPTTDFGASTLNQ